MTTRRTAEEHRKTLETDVRVRLALDGTGEAAVSTGVGFYDHLLSSFAHHGMFDLRVETIGDLDSDEHHTVEDTALVIGSTLAKALGERAGIFRYGEASVPMDEALARAVVDAGGRPYSVLDLRFVGERVGALGTQMIPHALESLARTGGLTLHLDAAGRNDHHIAEAAFKALGRALRAAVARDDARVGIPSTKGAT
jgi:imidazoleglycerol-phosphate dehydratase